MIHVFGLLHVLPLVCIFILCWHYFLLMIQARRLDFEGGSNVRVLVFVIYFDFVM